MDVSADVIRLLVAITTIDVALCVFVFRPITVTHEQNHQRVENDKEKQFGESFLV
jgi:hypothetical protein